MVPGARQGHVAGVTQVDQASGKMLHGQPGRGAGGQGLEFEVGVYAAWGCREASHLSL